MLTVITYGSFDLFHIGHLKLFRALKAMGGRLVVGVSTDEFNSLKGKQTIIPFEHRIEIVRAIREVDVAFPETSWEQKAGDIRTHRADVFAMGEDWRGRFDDLAELCRVVYLPRTRGVSSSALREQLFSPDGKQDLDLLDSVRRQLGD